MDKTVGKSKGGDGRVGAVDGAPRFKQRGEGVGAVDTLREEVRSHATNDVSDPGDEMRRRFRGSQRDAREAQWIRQINNALVMIPTIVEMLTERRGFAMEVCLNCGAMACYIDKVFSNAKKPMDHHPRPVLVYNADGNLNKEEPITLTVTL